MKDFEENDTQMFDRYCAFDILFCNLLNTSGRTDKELVIKEFKEIYPEYVEDLTYILETLAGKHKIGWSFTPFTLNNGEIAPWITSIKDAIEYCITLPSKDVASTMKAELNLGTIGTFLEPIVNRTLKLGIGLSLLPKTALTPMLAKRYKYEPINKSIAITEKLDGNRCIAFYDGIKWCYVSRSGKPLQVDFDMSPFDVDVILDGEILSVAQTQASIKLYDSLRHSYDFNTDLAASQLEFNKTSGLINSKCENKNLIYNVFDIVDDNLSYADRREMLYKYEKQTNEETGLLTANVRILPVLAYVMTTLEERTRIIDRQGISIYSTTHTPAYLSDLLYKVVKRGGEGIMINYVQDTYKHTRTGSLLKLKQVQYMDMKVIGVNKGKDNAKYEECAGALVCTLTTDDGNIIECEAGGGLSDAQRELFWNNPDAIIGKIVQIAYHEITQSAANIGTNVYSLRFPRLICIREDKTETSEY